MIFIHDTDTHMILTSQINILLVQQAHKMTADNKVFFPWEKRNKSLNSLLYVFEESSHWYIYHRDVDSMEMQVDVNRSRLNLLNNVENILDQFKPILHSATQDTSEKSVIF